MAGLGISPVCSRGTACSLPPSLFVPITLQVITKLLYLLHQGETFTKVSATVVRAARDCAASSSQQQRRQLACAPHHHSSCLCRHCGTSTTCATRHSACAPAAPKHKADQRPGTEQRPCLSLPVVGSAEGGVGCVLCGHKAVPGQGPTPTAHGVPAHQGVCAALAGSSSGRVCAALAGRVAWGGSGLSCGSTQP